MSSNSTDASLPEYNAPFVVGTTKGAENASEKRDLDSKQEEACPESVSEEINSCFEHNATDAENFLTAMHNGRDWYLVAIHPDKPGINALRTGDSSELSAWLAKHGDWNIYFTVNEPVGSHPGEKKCSKSDIKFAHFLHVDVDPRAGEDLGVERARILRLLTENLPKGVFPPTFIIDSGGGYQALWLLREPFAVASDANGLAAIEGRSRWLESHFGADACHNIDRVLRLPGTVNWPNARKRSKGRKAAMARLVRFEASNTYALAQFPLLNAVVADRAPRLAPVAVGESVRRLQSVDDLPALVPDRIKVIIVQGRHPDEGPKADDDSRSAWLFDAVCGLVRAGCDDETIFAAITDPVWLISASILDKGSKARAYAIRQIEKARETVSSNGLPSADSRPRWATLRVNKATGELIVVPDFENTRVAINALCIVTEHDIFHDRRILGGHAIGRYVGELSDDACLYIRHLIFKTYGWQPNKHDVLDAAWLLCNVNPVDPVCRYLDGLRWDGVQRLDIFANSYLRAEDNQLNAAIGRKMLIAAVRRARRPGCKFDYVPVLEGPQGCGKSTAVRILAGDENFSDKGVLHIEDRAQQEAVKGVWLYELAELAGLGKKDVNRIKAFVSQQDDRGRAAYARWVTSEKRRCIFIGTTNDAEYLLDTTGNRRFWPIGVGQVDLTALRHDRDQLWAEAALAEAAGEELEIPSNLWAELAERHRERMQGGDWADALSKLYGELCMDSYRISSQECYDVLGVKKDQWRDYRVAENLKRAMASLGWTQHGKFRINGRPPVRGFSRSLEAHEEAVARYGRSHVEVDTPF
jgi:hypothetical protein